MYLCNQIPNDMSDFVIYLKLKPFVRQWLINSFGDPVKFDPQSVSNKRIRSVLMKAPANAAPEVAADGLTAVCIPYSSQKDPTVWNYVSAAGKKFIIGHIEDLFDVNFWTEMCDMAGDDTRLSDATAAWCSMHGIDLDYSDTLRIKYWREKQRLLDKGIDTRRKSRSHKKRF